MAVVDPELRVHRIAGLRVADAVTIMIGERVADLGREQLRLAA
jgi:choline dehydrogenase-like flavoprotein